MTPLQLAQCTSSTLTNAARFADPLAAAMALYAIDTQNRQAAFLANVSIETNKLQTFEEDLNYSSAERLALIYSRVFKTPAQAQYCVRNPVVLSRLLYQGYHGRGGLMLTWINNYRAASQATGRDYVGHPELLIQPSDAALSAAWFWNTNGCNVPADRGDMTEVTRIVNGPKLLNLDERIDQFRIAFQALS